MGQACEVLREGAGASSNKDYRVVAPECLGGVLTYRNDGPDE